MNWPEGAKYHVHVFELDGLTRVPEEAARLFRKTLALETGYRLRKCRVDGWWDFSGGRWWAKAHSRAFDCEANWPPLYEATPLYRQ